MGEYVSILDGNTFVVSDRNGDIDPSSTFPTGLFSFDTRFLSAWQLKINGQRLHALSVDDLQYFETRFFLVPGAPAHDADSALSVVRQRTIGGSFSEELTVLNHGEDPLELEIRVDVDCDFADLFEVKNVTLEKMGIRSSRVADGSLRFMYEREMFRRETVIWSSEPAEFDEHGLTFRVRIDPNRRWLTSLQVETSVLPAPGRAIQASLRAHASQVKLSMRQDLDRWLEDAPKLVSSYDALTESYERGMVDLAALRFVSHVSAGMSVPAAGLPWFMTLFGRDSILTSLQALPFRPDLAAAALRVLAATQGHCLDDFRDQEPGKVVHEIRYGESAAFEEQPHTAYFGSADATPLFVVLLDEYERWTGDGDLVRLLEYEARAALRWIDRYGDLMGDGYVWYQRRNTKNGLENQCWKDSWDSISYRDGRLPGFPRATCELQGYAYDAKVRGARLAREFWNDPGYAAELEEQAANLKDRFNRDFWVEDGEFFALALDNERRPVDVLSSNIGHLLWSGIVETSRADRIAQHLLGPRLFSGWGVRTLAVGEARYNPIGYHVGAVWPFDNSFIAWGLWRYGFRKEASRVAVGIIDAARYFRGRLPEAFAGYDRELTKYPVEYPTACNPQAWSTGAPMLLLRTMLGLEPQGDHLVVDPAFPTDIGRIGLLNIPGRWGRANAVGRGRL